MIFIIIAGRLLPVSSAYSRSYVMYLFGVAFNYVDKTINLGRIFGRAALKILT